MHTDVRMCRRCGGSIAMSMLLGLPLGLLLGLPLGLIVLVACAVAPWRAEPAPSHCPDRMVRVPAGTFRMGSPEGAGDDDERPVHEVTLSTYCIDRTEVTVRAYAACVAARRCTPAELAVSPFCNREDRPDRSDHPINCVDWTQAMAYCAWAGKRLPSEAEWEYAARGRDGRVYPWGNDLPSASRLNACGTECVALGKRALDREWRAMYGGDDGWETTSPVGSFPAGASPFGALDMAGNVWEWTADWRGDYPAVAATNPRGPATGTARINRGGGWHGHLVEDARTALRSADPPSRRSNSVGMRCVAPISE
jgi:formylglycine-generating enzyme required for sulfatase activity